MLLRFIRFSPFWALGFLMIGWFFPATLVAAVGTTNLFWHWSNPLPFGNNIADLIGDPARGYVAVADHGQIIVSNDFSEWFSLETGTRKYFRAAAFHSLGGDTNSVVVSGEAGLILRLDAARNVSTTDLGTSDWLEGVAASSTRLVTVGDHAAIYSSEDGTNWVRRTAGVTNWLRSVTWRESAGLFAAVGEVGVILTSPDGVTWTRRTTNTKADLNRVVSGPTGFVAVGNSGTVLLGSTDGQKWTPSSSGASDDLFAVDIETRIVQNRSVTVPLVGGASELRSAVAVGNGFIWTDELDTRRTAAAPVSSYFAGVFDGTRHVLGGQAGLLVTGTRSTGTGQPLLWTPFPSPPRAVLWDVGTGISSGTNTTVSLVNGAPVVSTSSNTNAFYCAVGYGPTILQSDRGLTWTTSLLPRSASNTVFLGVGGRSDLLVAVGSHGYLATSPAAYETLVSTNRLTNGTTVFTVILTNQINTLGLVWLDAPTGVTNDLQGVAANPSLFVTTGGNGTILTSPDAFTWTRRATPTTRFLSGVDASPVNWVTTGDQGTILLSPDGIGWTAQLSGTTNWLWRVRWLTDRFLAVGQGGTILSSHDGTTWIPTVSGVTNWLYDVEQVDGTYYAAGGQGTVLGSTDGVAWTPLDTITGKPLYGLATLRGQLLVVGSEGVILRSQAGPFPVAPALTKWPSAASEQLFLIRGQMDQRFSLDRSTTLDGWSPGLVTEITEADGSLLLLDTTTNAVDHQLFRAAERR